MNLQLQLLRNKDLSPLRIVVSDKQAEFNAASEKLDEYQHYLTKYRLIPKDRTKPIPEWHLAAEAGALADINRSRDAVRAAGLELDEAKQHITNHQNSITSQEDDILRVEADLAGLAAEVKAKTEVRDANKLLLRAHLLGVDGIRALGREKMDVLLDMVKE